MSVVLRGAQVVDGSGGPTQQVDVGIEGGRIVAVGDVATNGAEVIDLDGLVLSPGFIDIHTHLDAQIFWDPDITPCSWYGVTSMVMGNCGFGIAPTRPEQQEAIARIMENVEDMSYECLQAGVPWNFETYPQYLDAVDRVPKRINVASMIGHTPTRMYVLGEEGDEREEVTTAELDQMRALIDEGLRAGAVGFATSRFPTANGRNGKPVPSRIARAEECRYLAEAVRDAGHGVLMAAVGPGLTPSDLAQMSAQWGIPATWAPWSNISDPSALTEIESLGANVLPQFLTRPVTAQMNLRKPFFFGSMPEFRPVIEAPIDERPAIYSDPAWRDRTRPAVAATYGERLTTATIAVSDNQPELVGRRLIDVAAERGVDVFDAMIDIGLADDLDTRFQLILGNNDPDWILNTLNGEHCAVGLGDAGAHSSQLCDACQPVHILGHWVRDTGAISLEHAIWRLTRQPADLFGFADRGRIEVGAIADLVAFDLSKVNVAERERAFDLPAGAERLIVRATGIEHVWVNGTAIYSDGKELPNVHPGTLIRQQQPHRSVA
jgi:N-acyl-D-amino-acid deacylase